MSMSNAPTTPDHPVDWPASHVDRSRCRGEDREDEVAREGQEDEWLYPSSTLRYELRGVRERREEHIQHQHVAAPGYPERTGPASKEPNRPILRRARR